MIVGTRGSILGLLAWQTRNMLLFATTAAVVYVAHRFLHTLWFKIPPLPVAVVGGALGIFISFRTNAAYARWWEGRQLWGRLINNSRTFATQVIAYAPAPLQRALIERHILYVHVVRCLLRDQDPWKDEEVVRFSTDDQRAVLAKASNAAHALIHEQHLAVTDAANKQELTEQRLDSFDRTFAAIIDVQGGCERIKRTPMPRAYTVFADTLTKAYGVLFPLAIVPELGIATIPINVLVCIAFMMISEVGRVLEDPFTMFFNGLPLSALSRTIENNLRDRLGDKELLPMLQPNEIGVLM
jgi:ion channel-forming bestrophin family protein